MQYQVDIKPQAEKDIRRLSKTDRIRVLDALLKLQDNLAGDVYRGQGVRP